MSVAKEVVGREADLHALSAALESTSGALVVGPAGVGKTHLVRSFLDGVRRTATRVEYFVASPTTQQVPFGALSPVLAQAKLVGANKADQLAQGICSLLGDSDRSRRPALMFDDVDLLDAESADVVYQLGFTGQASIWMTIRSGEPIPPPIEGLLRSGDIHRIDLAPINRDDATRIAEGFLGGALEPSAADALWGLTLGIPLYLRETVNDSVTSGLLRQDKASWKITGPLEPGQRVQDLLVRRLERLSAKDRTVLEMVALAEPVAVTLLKHSDQDAAIDLVRRGLLQWRDGTTKDALVSGHPLLAKCTRGVVPPARAQDLLDSLASRAASAKSVPYGTNLSLVEAARSVGADLGVTTLVAAAREALAAFHPTNALSIAKMAADIGPEHPGAQHVLGQVLQMAGDANGAEHHLATALELSNDDDGIAQIANTLSNLLSYTRADPRSAIIVLQHAAKRLKSPMAQLTMSVDTAVVAGMLGHFPAVLEIGYEILLVEGLDDNTRAITLGNICYAQAMLVELDRFDSDWADAIALASSERLGDRPAEFDLLWCLAGSVSIERGELRAGLAALEQHLAECRSEDRYRGIAEMARAHLLIARGDGEAVDAVEESLGQLATMDPFNSAVLSRATGALAATLAGDNAAATDYLDGLRADDVTDDPRAIVWLGRAQAAQAAAAGDLQEAASLAAAAGIEAVKRTFSGWGALALHDAVRYRHPSMVVEELAEHFGTCGAPFLELLARHARTASLGDVEGLRSVAREFSSMGAALHAGEAWLDVALQETDESRGQIAIVAAQLIAADIALNQWFIWSGVEPVLSPRETDVVGAAVSGASSKGIADRLYMSVRTVDNHLGRVYRRLGVTGRADLIETFRSSGPR